MLKVWKGKARRKAKHTRGRVDSIRKKSD
jgi:hypothetical protein